MYIRDIFDTIVSKKKKKKEDISLVLVFYILFWQVYEVGKYIEQSGTSFIEIEGWVSVWLNLETIQNLHIWIIVQCILTRSEE